MTGPRRVDRVLLYRGMSYGDSTVLVLRYSVKYAQLFDLDEAWSSL